MRRLAVLLSMAVVLAGGPARADDAADVNAAFQAVQAARQARDAAALRQLVDPGYVMHHGYGRAETFEPWLALATRGALARQQAEGTEYDVRVRVFGDTAVRSWIVRLRRPDRDSWSRGTGVFMRTDGAWRAVSQQSTVLHEGPVAPPRPLAAYAGRYTIPGRAPVAIADAHDYLAMTFEGGAELPLTPLGPGDRFSAGFGSTMVFERDAGGRVIAAERLGDDGERWWRAERDE